jgi:hypothetical protein
MMALQQMKQEITNLKLQKKGIKRLFSHPKFIEIEKPLNIEDKSIVLNAELKESVNEIDAVVISAGSMEASDKNVLQHFLTL